MLISDLGQRHQRPWSKVLAQGVVQHLDQWSWSKMQTIGLGQRWPRSWSKRRCWSKILVKDVDPGCWSRMVMKDLGLAKAGLVAWSCSKRLVKDSGERFLPKDDLGPRPQPKIWNQDFPQRCWSKMLGKDLGQWPWSKILGQDVGPRCCSRSWSVTLTKNADQWPLSQTPKTLIQAVGPRCCSTSWPVALITNANHWSRPKMAKVLVQEEILVKDFGQRCWSRMLIKDGGERHWLGQSWSCCRILVQEVSQRYCWKVLAQRWSWPKTPIKDLELRSSSKVLTKDVEERPWPMTLIKGLGERWWSKLLFKVLVNDLGQQCWPMTLVKDTKDLGPRCCSTSWSVALGKNANH